MKRDELQRIILDTAGQGTDFACLLISYAIGKAINEKLGQNDFKDSVKVNGTRVPPCLFVDDINAISESYSKLQNQCDGISRALDTLSLQANEKKTMIIVRFRP